MVKQRRGLADGSPGGTIEATVSLIGGKWKCFILRTLLEGPARFNELRRQMPTVTPRMLTLQLRELETDGLVMRRTHVQFPTKVEYALSVLGQSLEPIFDTLEAWGRGHLQRSAAEPSEEPPPPEDG